MSRNTRLCLSYDARSSALSPAFGVVEKPHGYCVISSEWASTITFTVVLFLDGLVSLRPISAPRRPFGATSVRWSPMPSIDGSA